jgi:hypothetical protein
MPALREQQQRLLSALFAAEPGGEAERQCAQLVRGAGLAPAQRIAVYRNNLRENFFKVLALQFPVIERLVGADYFRALAAEYLQAHPSASGNLQHIGGHFAQFLARKFGGAQFEYLTDVARLEWALELSTVAADGSGPLDIEALRNLLPEQYGGLRFGLHPACALVASRFPIWQIWQANQPTVAQPPLIELDAGGESVLLRRDGDATELRRIAREDYELLRELAEGSTLAAALEAAQEVEAEFDLAAALARYAALLVIVAVERPG